MADYKRILVGGGKKALRNANSANSSGKTHCDCNKT